MTIDSTISLLTVHFPVPVEQFPKQAAVAMVDKGWQGLKGSVQAMARLAETKVNAFEPEAAVDDMVGHKGIRSCEFFAMMDKDLVGAYWTDHKSSVRILAEDKVPLDVEEIRVFLTRLNGWSYNGKKLVTDADVKQFEADFPRKPKVYKDLQEMNKKDRNAVLAFRSWALRNKGSKAYKAYSDLLDTQNIKASDPARVKALKAIDEALKDYYKSF